MFIIRGSSIHFLGVVSAKQPTRGGMLVAPGAAARAVLIRFPCVISRFRGLARTEVGCVDRRLEVLNAMRLDLLLRQIRRRSRVNRSSYGLLLARGAEQ